MSPAEMVAVALGGAAVIADLRSRRIPNWLSVSGVAAGILCGACNAGARGAAMAVAGAGAGFAAFLLFHLLGGLGGGDVKLMAAFGAFLGPSDVLTAAVIGALAGALLAMIVLLWRPRTAAIPYAPAIVIGAWLVLGGRR
jgi:prepilin peptidase CpaA